MNDARKSFDEEEEDKRSTWHHYIDLCKLHAAHKSLILCDHILMVFWNPPSIKCPEEAEFPAEKSVPFNSRMTAE